MLVDLGRNDLSRVCRPGTVDVERFLEPERFSHVTHLVSEVTGELRDGVDAVRPPARVLPGRHGLRRAEGARDAADLRAGGLPARAVRGRGRLRAAGRRRSTRASRSGRSSCTTASRYLQAGAGIVADSDPAAEHEECLRKLAALEAAIDLAEAALVILLIDNYDSFTYNLAHLFGELGAEVVVRRNDALDADEAERLAPSHLVVSPGPGRPGDAGATPSRSSRRLAPTCRPSASASATRRSSRHSAARSARRSELVHGKASPVAHDGRGLFAGLPRGLRGGPLPLARGDSVPDVLEVSATSDGRRGDGGPPPRAADRRRPVPPRSRC